MKLHIMPQQVLSAPFSNASNLVIPFDYEIHVHPYTQRKNEIMTHSSFDTLAVY